MHFLLRFSATCSLKGSNGGVLIGSPKAEARCRVEQLGSIWPLRAVLFRDNTTACTVPDFHEPGIVALAEIEAAIIAFQAA